MLNRETTLLVSAEFIKWVSIGYFIIVLPIYLYELGVSPTKIGALLTLSGLVNVIILVFAGKLADTYGRKKFLVVGMFLPIFAHIIFFLTTNLNYLILAYIIGGVTIIGGISEAFAYPSWLSMLSDTANEKNRQKIISLGMVSWSLAISVGSLLTFLPHRLETHFGLSFLESHRVMFLVLTLCPISAFILCLFTKEQINPNVQKLSKANFFKSSNSPLKVLSSLSPEDKPKVMKLISVMLFLGISFMIYQLSPLWFNIKFSITEIEIGPWFSLARIGAVIGILFSPIIVKKLNYVKSVSFAWIFGSFFIFFMMLPSSYESAATMFIGYSIALNLSFPIIQTFILSIFPKNLKTTASALTLASWGISSSLSPILGGYLIQNGHLDLPFIIAAFCYGFGGIVFFFFFRKIKVNH